MLISLEMKLSRRRKQGNLRQLQVESMLIDFASNDTLGLARSAAFSSAYFAEWKENGGSLYHGLGSTGSRLLTGNSAYAQILEEEIAALHGVESATLFSCGYMANLGLLTAIAADKNVIIYDVLAHASILDGIRLSRAQAFPFRHNDVDHLESRLKSHCGGKELFICIESIYSTDGSVAPLQKICQLANQYGAHVIVDEAHAIGVYGPKGCGIVQQHRLASKIFAQVITFGKALGSYGAAILGHGYLKQFLNNFARPYIYTTALPLQVLMAIRCSYRLFPKMDLEREHLKRLIQVFQKRYPGSSTTHIQSISMPGNDAVKRASKCLSDIGYDVRPLTSPTVRRGHEILRLCLHSFNSEEELNDLINHLDRYGRNNVH